MSQLRQGDILLFHTNDGGEMSFINGEPVMDGGFESAAELSINGHDGSPLWMDEYMTDEEKPGRKFISYIFGVPKTLSNMLIAKGLAEQDLSWFKSTGKADEINVDISSLSRNVILLSIQILVNGKTVFENEWQINWSFEKNDPAHKRI